MTSSENNQQRRLATILAADIVGYSRLMDADEEATYTTWKTVRSGIIDPMIEEHRGRIVKHTGDGFLAEFPTVLTAMQFAMALQEEMKAFVEDTPEDQRIIFRIGINLGDIIVEDDGDIFGDGVNVAARLESLGIPGGICISGPVYESVHKKLDASFDDLGDQSVKNISSPVHAYDVRWAGEGGTPGDRAVKLTTKSPAGDQVGQSITINPSRKLIYIASGLLLVALGYFAYNNFMLDPERDAALLQSAGEQVQQPADSGTGTAEPDPASPSIAVLPFVNMSDDQSNEYFADGLAEELLNILVRIPQLRVAARTSSFSYKGKDIQIAQIGRELKVTHVLEGSVRKSGNQLRITAQLIEASEGFHLWSETYDRTLDNIFQVQDEISAAVVDGLKITLLEAIPHAQETDSEVYALYLQGKYFITPPQGGKESVEKGVAAFKQALAIDPHYAPAWTGLSWAYEYQIRYRVFTKEQGAALALEAAEKALAIDDQFALAWSTLSYLKKKYDWDWQGAKDASEKALLLEPNNTDVLLGVASVTAALGQLDRSIELLEHAVTLDPLGLTALADLGNRYRLRGRYDDALENYRKILVLHPESSWALEDIIRTYLDQGNPDRALAELNKLPPTYRLNSLKAQILFTLGEEIESRAINEEFLNTTEQKFPVSKASIYAWRGENDSAFEWLEVAFEQHDSGLANILVSDALGNLKTDPRYPVFLEKMGLLEAWKAMPTD